MTLRSAPGVLLGLLTCLQAAHARAPDQERYERNLIDASLDAAGLVSDPHPEGKIIEEIVVVRHPIVEASDPWPSFLNIFHVVTREHIIRQELLFEVGQGYDEERVRESARNLRAMPLLFSTVRIVTATGERPGTVKVVVITKDLWSIRLNSNFNVGGGVFNFASLMPSEMNFLGYNQQVSVYGRVDRDVVSFGQVYRVPRLLGSRFTAAEQLILRVNHHDGSLEGGTGAAVFGLPLYAISSEWGFSINAAFDIGTDRFYEGASLRKVWIPYGIEIWPLAQVYRHRRFDGRATVVRSFGEQWKTNLRFGYGLRAATYRLDDSFPDVDPGLEQAFSDRVLPVDDRAGELFFSVEFYRARYRRFLNIQTYGLTEDFRIGPRAFFEAAWANPAFGFAQRSVKLGLELGWRFLLAGDILELGAAVALRRRPGHGLVGVDTHWVDRYAELFVENVSPELFGLGRLLVRLRYVYSQYQLDRSEQVLGGDNTLRGFVSGYAFGPRLFNVNAEFRSRPWEFRTLHVGFVLFYDGGDAYGFSPATDFEWHQSVGFGIRGLFPQFDRGTMRLDVGFPLGPDFNTDVWSWVTLAYLQAF